MNTQKEEMEYLEKTINDGLDNLYYTYNKMEMMEDLNLHYDNYEYDRLKDNFESIANATYIKVLAYFELKGLKTYLQKFIDEFDNKIKTLDIYQQYYHEESGDTVSQLYLDFRSFLKPFKFNESGEFDSIYLNQGLTYLERILMNTDLIIKLQQKVIHNEPDIYKTIKPFIEIFFPSVLNTEGSVILNKLKKYKPDIFIPELHVAVEYKYINTLPDIKSTISEIADDVKGYKEKIGTNEYQLFYSVFYISDSLLTKERFQELWREREYPDTWRAIPVFERT
jgi:hypothetical protein